MSSREPLWFCHQCQAEMRPLMVPDPVCASCHGSFVEKMDDDNNDDPRQFQSDGPLADYGDDNNPPGMDNFLLSLHNLMNRSSQDIGTRTRTRSPDPFSSTNTGGSGFTLSIRNNRGEPRSFSIGSARPRRDGPPTMSEFTRGGPTEPGAITGPMMAQYLMSLLGQRDPFSELMAGPGSGGPGRMGDYVFNQQALDEIITHLMENSNGTHPVPATEGIMDNLPREVLELGSSTLEKDCAVCKEQFKVDPEQPDENVVVTLPCKHPFHEGCIMPWLKSSGTCPVCRHALVPQPEHHPPPQTGANQGSSSPSSSPSQTDGGFFTSLFGAMGGSSAGSSSRPDPSSRRQSRNSRDHDDNHHNVPGGWDDELD